MVAVADPVAALHPAVAAWLRATFGAPTEPQARAWPAIQAGRHTLIAAPTGSGKTLAAFLCALDALVRRGLDGGLPDATHVLYVSPLKALSNDIEKNLAVPLAGIRAELAARGLHDVDVRTAVRTGDTRASQRTGAVKKPPHIFVTTPESLYILLTSAGGRRMLSTVRTVIVDEIHAMVGDKRGSHLALSLERLDALAGRPVQRIGLSATQRPIEEVARFLVGAGHVGPDGAPDCVVVDHGHVRARDVALEVPSSPLESVMSGEVWTEVYDRLAALVRAHRTTLVFVNTRRLAERVTRHLGERLGEDRVTSHHGSLSREHRLAAEQRLKSGALSALVATASLELGIDVGDVDLVCQIGPTRSIAAFLQRVGRSGHHLKGTPKGRLFPLSRDELVDSAALVDAVRRGELDRLRMPEAPLDILAQQIVAAAAEGDGWSEDALFDLVRRAWPYRGLTREAFDAVVEMTAQGFVTGRGRRSAHVFHDAVNRTVRPRKHARIAAMTSGGAIPDVADYEVVLEPTGIRVGSLNEDFAIESLAGDVFQLGNASYRILRVEPGKVRVEDARGQPPNVPFWLGEAPARTAELSHSVSRLRSELASRLEAGGTSAAVAWLRDEVGIGEAAGAQLADYVAATVGALGVVPTEDALVLERFFDETGGMHVVLHSPLGGRINRALGLALRKCFCRKFDFELQAAANEDALVLSLGPTHSFPLEDVYGYLRSASVRDVLVQALLVAPMFATRWRWNATRALAVLRFRGGKKVPARLQRMDAEDLLTVCFPDQVACQENLAGDREIPEHPLVQQTVHDCLTEAMDIDGLVRLVERIEKREIALFARDVVEPSPLASSILNARPYAFLDDAPLEERRTQAVMSRRWLDPAQAADIGALDPLAVERVTREAWPEPRDADELCDALSLLGVATEDEARRGGWSAWLDALRAQGRAARFDLGPGAGTGAETGLWAATERVPEVRAVHPRARWTPDVRVPARHDRAWVRSDALREIVRSRLESSGPVTAAEIARALGVPASDVAGALTELEVEGVAMRGAFRAGAATGSEWCERRLLARIHRGTLQRLRAEIEPVSTADYVRFAIAWQRAGDDARLEGPTGLAAAVELLEGFEAPAAAWETELLPARVRGYDPAWLDALSFAGRITWLRRSPATGSGRASGPVRSTPIALVPRGAAGAWLAAAVAAREAGEAHGAPEPTGDAAAALQWLEAHGASFHADVARGAHLLPASLEAALGQLVTRGRVTSDGFSGLRALLVPADRRRAVDRRGRRRPVSGIESAGRWSLLPRPAPPADGDVEAIARALLRRWGVVFRKVVEREGSLPPWRDILRYYRRMEARGELRGGRFVDGVTGEQYALPEAVGALREARRRPRDGALVAVSAADPLNLVGILTPGDRVPAIAQNRVLYRDGVPVAVRESRVVRILDRDAGASRAEMERAVVRLPRADSPRRQDAI